MGSFSDLRDLCRAVGPVRFVVLIIATTAVICCLAAFGLWLEGKVGWPEAYGFNCTGKGCVFDDLYNSPKLLEDGRPFELLLFGWMWCFPVSMLLMCGAISLARWLKRRRNRIRPLR